MLESGAGSDVTLKTRDNQEIPAHRVLLSMQNTVFAAMFPTDMTEKREGVVTLPDISSGGLKILLKFLYTGELDDKWGYFYDEIVNALTLVKLSCLKLGKWWQAFQTRRIARYENCKEED